MTDLLDLIGYAALKKISKTTPIFVQHGEDKPVQITELSVYTTANGTEHLRLHTSKGEKNES